MAALIVQRRKIKQSEKQILLAEIGGIQFFFSFLKREHHVPILRHVA